MSWNLTIDALLVSHAWHEMFPYIEIKWRLGIFLISFPLALPARPRFLSSYLHACCGFLYAYGTTLWWYCSPPPCLESIWSEQKSKSVNRIRTKRVLLYFCLFLLATCIDGKRRNSWWRTSLHRWRKSKMQTNISFGLETSQRFW